MTTHAALLRAINVAGRAVVPMEDLRRAFERAGCRDVRTVIQSGNVLFTAPVRGLEALKGRIREAVGELLGAAPVVVYRSAEELRSLVEEADPFRGAGAGPDTKLYAAFWAGPPATRPVVPVVDGKEGLELVGLEGGTAFIVSRRVNGRFGFPNGLVEKVLGVEATTRNWTTVRKLAALAAAVRSGPRPAR